MKVKQSHSVVSDSCDPMDYRPSLPGSSIHRILQARILEWVSTPISRGFSQPREWAQVSCIAGRFFTVWATSGTRYFPDSQSEKCFPIHSGLLHAELDVDFSIRCTGMRQPSSPCLPSPGCTEREKNQPSYSSPWLHKYLFSKYGIKKLSSLFPPSQKTAGLR